MGVAGMELEIPPLGTAEPLLDGETGMVCVGLVFTGRVDGDVSPFITLGLLGLFVIGKVLGVEDDFPPFSLEFSLPLVTPLSVGKLGAAAPAPTLLLLLILGEPPIIPSP
jgi:hypothetical protein